MINPCQTHFKNTPPQNCAESPLNQRRSPQESLEQPLYPWSVENCNQTDSFEQDSLEQSYGQCHSRSIEQDSLEQSYGSCHSRSIEQDSLEQAFGQCHLGSIEQDSLEQPYTQGHSRSIEQDSLEQPYNQCHLGSIEQDSLEQPYNQGHSRSIEQDSIEQPYNQCHLGSIEQDSLERPYNQGNSRSIEQDSLEQPYGQCHSRSIEQDSLEQPYNQGHSRSIEQDSLEQPYNHCHSRSIEQDSPEQPYHQGHSRSIEQESLEQVILEDKDMSFCSMIGGTVSQAVTFEQDCQRGLGYADLDQGFLGEEDMQCGDVNDAKRIEDESLEAYAEFELTANSLERKLLERELNCLLNRLSACSASTAQCQRVPCGGPQGSLSPTTSQGGLRTWGTSAPGGGGGINIRYMDGDYSMDDCQSNIPSFSFPVYGIQTTPVPVGASTPVSSPGGPMSGGNESLEMEADSFELEQECLERDKSVLEDLFDSLEVAMDILEVDIERIEIKELARLKQL